MAEINLKKDAASAETDRVKAKAEQMLWVSFYQTSITCWCRR